MKAFLVLDELHHFHWALLKSVLLILSLLPMSQAAFSLWQSSVGSSQIMIAFFALSVLSAWLVLCFLSALKSSVWHCHALSSNVEQVLFKVYRTIPMLCLASLVAYLVLQWSLYL